MSVKPVVASLKIVPFPFDAQECAILCYTVIYCAQLCTGGGAIHFDGKGSWLYYGILWYTVHGRTTYFPFVAQEELLYYYYCAILCTGGGAIPFLLMHRRSSNQSHQSH